MQPISLLFATIVALSSGVWSFDITRNDNLAVYCMSIVSRWFIQLKQRIGGQDSAGNQGSLSSYCEDDTIDNIIMAFL